MPTRIDPQIYPTLGDVSNSLATNVLSKCCNLVNYWKTECQGAAEGEGRGCQSYQYSRSTLAVSAVDEGKMRDTKLATISGVIFFTLMSYNYQKRNNNQKRRRHTEEKGN